MLREINQTRESALHDSLYVRLCGDSNQNSGCLGVEGRERDTKEILGVMQMFCILIGVET